MGTAKLARRPVATRTAGVVGDDKHLLKHQQVRGSTSQASAEALLSHVAGPGVRGAGSLTPQHALALQRLAGNVAVTQMVTNAPAGISTRSLARTASSFAGVRSARPVVQRDGGIMVQRADPEKREAKETISVRSLSLTGEAGLDLSDRLKLEVKSDLLANVPGVSLGVAGEYLDSGAGKGKAKGLVILGVGGKKHVFSVVSYGGAKPDGTLVFYVAPKLKLGRFSCTVKGGPEHKKGDETKDDTTKGAIEAKCEWNSRVAGTFSANATVTEIKPGATPQVGGAIGYTPRHLKSMTLFAYVTGPMSEPPINSVGPGSDRTPMSPDKLPGTTFMFGITLDLPDVLMLLEKRRRRLPSRIGR